MKTTKCTIDRKVKLGLGIATAVFTFFGCVGMAEGGYDAWTAIFFILMGFDAYYLIKK